MGKKSKNPMVSMATVLSMAYVLTSPEGQELLHEATKLLKAYRKAEEKKLDKREELGNESRM